MGYAIKTSELMAELGHNGFPGSLLKDGTLARLIRTPSFWIATIIMLVAIIVALFGAFFLPHDPNAINLLNRFEPPSFAHWFGTDDLGRDIFSRMLVATRVSMLVPLELAAVAVVMGLPAGLLAGYSASRTATILTFVADVLMSFPPLVLAVAFIAIRGPGLTNAMIAIGVIFAPRLFRITRAATQEIMSETYIEAARAIGAPPMQLFLRHVPRNMAGPVIVFISFSMGTALLIEASLSFLGLGVQPPEAGWGSMLGRAFRFLYQSPTGIVFPGVAIALTVIAFNTLGDLARDALARVDDTGRHI